ncbi:hypothetical protein J2W56_000701 [Nocardia kruczakiae]|uniref:Uncharacterized protein n=1 Tax=Nocardia kruczakiae TaxID=261477 RepID=A0ABU1X8W6_9NOCA|nr:hypothetical protein [Nocardia kruczakiae]MDR7166983.1 hypothetical protein [Nocardia kruczakiae]
MRATADPSTRLRGGCVGAAACTVSIAAHALGGGTVAPGSAAIMMLIAASTAIGCLAAHTRTGLFRLMGLLAIGQLLGHLALTFSPHCHDVLITAPMLVAHLVATVGGAILVRGAEITLRRAVSLIRRAVGVVTHILETTGAPAVVSVPETVTAPRRLVLASGTGRRGPPHVTGSFAASHRVAAWA